jgi:RhtB (resistance to homoserine/threonine) family protein
MEYLTLIGSVVLIHLLAMISPGPNFIMAIRNSLTYSRKTGMYTAVGFGLAIFIHIFYCIAGLGIIISKSIIAFNFIKFLGAAYLIYLGIKSLRFKNAYIEVKEQQHKSDISALRAIKIGFLTNILNPKSTLFFLSLFTFVIGPEVPFKIQGLISLIMVINAMLWFSLVAIFFTQKRIQRIFHKFQKVFSQVFGGLLVAIGLKIIFSES